MGLKTNIDVTIKGAHGFTLDQGYSNLVHTVAESLAWLIYIRNVSTADRIEVGGVGATAFAGSGYPFKDDPAGLAVTNGATDVLRVSGVTSNQTYQIIIIGEST